MTEYAMRREGTHLVPVDPISAEEIAEIPTTADLLVTVRTPRNPRQHRLAWALADKVAEACDWLNDRSEAMDYLKMKAHHVRIMVEPKSGKTFIVPRSIAWASLPQAAFNRFFNRIVWIVCNDIVPGLKEKDLRDELTKMVGSER
jgi:hypothetical protein